jgi:pimeloyl-ACP methyl ester carboxylesterase
MYPDAMATLHPRRAILLMVSAVVLFYGLVIVFFASMETALIFPAPEDSPEQMARSAEAQGAEELWLETDSGETIYGWRIGQGEDLAILFTGNASGVGLEPDRYRVLSELGFSVLHLNYPGYPGSSGRPSELALEETARAAWAEARRTHAADQIVLYGKSLGGFAVLSLASDLGASGGEQPRAAVVESSFTSVLELAGEFYPWLPTRLFLKNRMASVERAPNVTMPVLLLHGAADDLIDIEHSRRLHAALPDSSLIELEGMGHNENLGSTGLGSQSLEDFLRDQD